MVTVENKEALLACLSTGDEVALTAFVPTHFPTAFQKDQQKQLPGYLHVLLHDVVLHIYGDEEIRTKADKASEATTTLVSRHTIVLKSARLEKPSWVRPGSTDNMLQPQIELLTITVHCFATLNTNLY